MDDIGKRALELARSVEREKAGEIQPFSINKIADKLSYDSNKSFSENAENLVDAVATANAVNDSRISSKIVESKGEELKKKAEAKAKEAEGRVTEAVAQNKEHTLKAEKANNHRYAWILKKFKGFSDEENIPNWIIYVLLLPTYILFIFPFDLVFAVVGNIVKWINYLFNQIAGFANGFTKTLGYIALCLLIGGLLAIVGVGIWKITALTGLALPKR